MTKEEIIEMAEEYFSSIEYDSGNVHECYEFSFKELVAFANLIAEKEREECAKLCDYVYNNIVTDEHIKNMAFKIRARGQQ